MSAGSRSRANISYHLRWNPWQPLRHWFVHYIGLRHTTTKVAHVNHLATCCPDLCYQLWHAANIVWFAEAKGTETIVSPSSREWSHGATQRGAACSGKKTSYITSPKRYCVEWTIRIQNPESFLYIYIIEFEYIIYLYKHFLTSKRYH